MTNYNYLGYGVTNENGVAKLEYNSEGQKIGHSYTGVGAGEIDVLASLDNPVSSGSIVSGTLSVWDTKWFDLASDNTKESSWYIDTTNTSVSYDGDGRTVTKIDSASSWRYFQYNDPTLSSTKVGNRYSIPIPNKIEFEVTAITGTVVIDILDNLNNHLDSYAISATGHYTIELDGTDVKIYKDNGTTPVATKTMNGANIRFGFVFNAYNESITYKDFKVYSI